MNWYRTAVRNFETQDAAFAAVRSALMALKYMRPDVDPEQMPFDQLASTLVEMGKVPQGVEPQRFAAMLLFYIRNGEEGL